MLRISFQDYDSLRQHGEQTYPHECCGVLLGHTTSTHNQVVRLVAAGNTRTDSAHNRYSISPVELIRIQRQARAESLDIVGFYHSHPDHPAQWSSTDIAEAHWLGCSYVITRVAGAGEGKGKADITNSFLLRGTGEEDKAFEDEPIEIIVSEPTNDTTEQPTGAL
jgi:proteasome lid subunit RPN8/RPN11